jgi:uncharacterized protein YhhL (DUF1145 family)
MSAAKKILLVAYAVLALLAVTQSDIALGQWSLRILLVLAVVHAVEVAIFFRFCREAGGSIPGHVVNLFFFGILHVQELKAARASA